MDEDGGTDSEVEEYSGMEQPPLIKQLKTILSEYPDDGQIIKELVQNAEDAVASEMKILYDGRTINTTTAKKLPYRKFFKAPALCFYNNAVFSDNDWRGIRMIYSSVKEEDPLKVGRFGLGFKSVFHITDNPCIISGSKILLMNPHEKVPGKVCISIKLKDLQKCRRMKVEEFKDALLGTFGFTADTLATGNYDGTIFWFPLRETPSALSDTCYDRDKVLDLFKSFQTEAVHSLLFLKSLCKIELFCRGSETELDLPEGREFFSVELHDSNNTVKNARAMFLREIKDTCGNIPNNDIVCIVQPRFETRFRTAGVVAVEATRSSWLVINVYKGGEMSERLRHLVSDKDLSYSPYVGAAVLLDNCIEPFKGHVFCFLPLPQEKKSLTGLPVHFNGFFALSQNRRHLKWASADQETLHMHRDKAIEWNECLVNEVLPQVYMKLIDEMITISGTHGNNGTSVEAVYKCIPDKSVVDDKWLGCVESLYQKLPRTEVIFVPNHSKWVLPRQPLYTMFIEQNVSCDTKDTVINTVNHCRTVEPTIVPIHLWEWIRKIDTARDITPAELSKLLRFEDAYKTALTPIEKLRLLEYITKDNEFELLQGLELLPLETASFSTFQGQGSTPATVFMCTIEEVSLFPGLEERFISTDVPKPLKEALQTLADQERFQIRHMAMTDMITLLETTIRQEMGTGEPVTLRLSIDKRFENWIENIWVYIMKHYQKSIGQFTHLPLIPCLASGRWDDGTWKTADVHLFTMKRTFMLKSGMGMEDLPNEVLPAFEYLSIVILPSMPAWFPVGEISCIFTSSGNSLLKLFDRIQSSQESVINNFNSRIQVSHIDALVVLLDRVNLPLTDRTIAFLQQLRLFRQCNCLPVINMQITFMSIRENSQIVNLSDTFPVHFPRPFLIPTSQSDLRFARKLRAIEICEETLVVEVLQAINGGSYSNDEVRKFMVWFLTNIYKFQSDPMVISHAKHVSFVPNGSGFCKPAELYDPRDAHLQVLFKEENKFPVGEFTSEKYINAMAQLGLKTRQDVSANCVYTTAKELDRMCRDGRDVAYISQKANALFQLLEENHAILRSTVMHTCLPLHSSVSQLKCILHEREKPHGYPENLVWKGSAYILCSPAELKSEIFAHTVGSLIPLVKASKSLCQMFQWNVKPGAKELTEQLRNIIAAYSSVNKPDLLPLISNVYKAMSEQCSEVIQCPEFRGLLQKNSIWWGDAFCLPNQIILEKQDNDIDLQPYMYPLPAELQTLRSFFSEIGCYLRQDTSALLSVQAMIAENHLKHDPNDENKKRKDLHIVLQILNKLYQENVNVTDVGEKLLFPVHTGDSGKLVLKPYTECTYCDAQWLKDLTDEDEEDEDEILYVHRDVLPSIAEGLGVKSLKKQLMSDAEGLEEWGQKEPLTRRLHNILKDGYVDGLAVPKEIIQNADDARATTVKFLYDERENADARTQLLDEGMADCQGPALWAYNDALFSNDDLENIIKLSGATKESDTTKIGKFGLGFCAVYNLTDVPSFVSGQNMVIFDPHMKYLNNALPGKSPGLKINLQKMKNKRLMKRMHNQFKPFQDVFGCDLSHDEPFYHGTLFRLPLRTPVQAGSSEIKNVSYTKEEMVTLLKKFVETSGNMMLFTQNLQHIKLFHIPASGVHPNDAQLLCTVNKDSATEKLSESMLDICSERKLNKELHCSPLAAVQKLILTLKCERAIHVLGDVKAEQFETNWLVSWATGTGKSLELCYSTTMAGALPLGSVAMLVETGKEQLTPKPLAKVPFGYYNTGHIFCYLPLPVQCKLNVHLNGSFAVASNRRGLQTNTEDDKYSYDTQWNDALLSDAVANAFINLLVCLHEYKSLQYTSLSEDYKFFQMWPTECPPVTMRFKQGFYENVAASDNTVFKSYNKWLGLKQCLFLKTEMPSDSDLLEITLSTLQRFRSNPSSGVVNLPSEYFRDLQNTDGWKANAVVVEEQDFFLRYFLPNITDGYWQERRENLSYRNKLLLYCLEHSTPSIDATLKEIDCIPTSHDGTLRRPRDLVHPVSRLSPLFSEEDCRFPEQSLRTYTVLRKLLDLGMMQELLQLDLVVERAFSVENLFSKGLFSRSYERCKHLIGYLASCRDLDKTVLQKLRDIQFLPVLQRPNSWPFKWAADDLDFKKQDDVVVYFEKPCNLFLHESKDLVACLEYILDVRGIPYSMYNAQLFVHLGVKTQSNLTLELVIVQLLDVCSSADNTRNVFEKRIEDQVFDSIYRFLDDKASRDPVGFKSVLPHLKDKPVIRLESELLPVSKVAFFVGHCCTPELYEIGKSKISMYRTFLHGVGVKDSFDILDVVQILRRKKNEFGVRKLPKNEVNLIRQLLELLSDIMQKSQLQFSDIGQYGEENIVAPDIDMILWPTNMLCHDDLDFSENSASMRFVHGDISRNVAETLGISTKKRTYLKDCEIGEPFEQKEELVTRLRGLLDGYPCDIGIMKELIQNADDANANEIHFIKDFRTHRCEKIFDNDYKEFQGPALIVYNDSPFSKADLKGIRNLGVGSKHEDPAKTGQYGVGFNAIYNLTDLPSFLTKGPEIEDGETLCLFDPLQKHCKGVAGKRYSTKKVRNAFPDVLSGYSEESVFGDTNIGTVFRFPLRLSESDISNSIVTTEKLNVIMHELKLELHNLLLFVRSVTKITVSDISTGSLKEELSVSVKLDESNTRKRIDFSLRCKERAKLIKTSKSVSALHPPSQVTYNLTLNESVGKEEEWFVVQRLGISGNIVPQQVKTAIESGQLGMLPVGGIALHIPRKCSSQSIVKSVLRYMFSASSQVTASAERGRLYCFLPLPVTTGLPMHINGHFVLDHEARRSLWCEENEKGYKSSWNFLLLSDIVARSYIEALKFLKENIFADGNTKGYSKQHFHEHLKVFHAYFPYGKKASDSYEKFLGQSIFKMIINMQEELFPITIRREATDNREKAETAYHVRWSSFHPDGHQFPVHFANVNDFLFSGGLDDLLIALGFKLTLCSPELIQSMSDYACSVKELTPGVVIQFLKSQSSPFCDRMQIYAIPSPVAETKFENIRNVERTLSFCSTAETFLNELNGLPLLVTNDGMLRCFDTNQTIYCTKYCSLLPMSASHFVHKHMVHKINSVVDENYGVRQEIPLTRLEEFLTIEMDDSKYTEADFVTFNPLSNIPGQTWLQGLWELILKGFETTNASSSAGFDSYLQPLQRWCLIPTVKDNANNVLVKIGKAYSVVDCDSFSWFPSLEAILRKLGLPRLNRQCLPTTNIIVLAKCLASPHNPLTLLICLYYHRDIMKTTKLEHTDSSAILTYFADNLEQMQKDNRAEAWWIRDRLRSLPIFLTQAGTYVSVENTDMRVLVLPRGIPTNGIEQWAFQARRILLQEDDSFAKIYKFLEFSFTETIDVYLDHILKTWNALPLPAIKRHLEYIRDFLLCKPVGQDFNARQTQLIAVLRKLPVIPHNYDRKTASSFYSPHVKIFRYFCSSSDFPPKDFSAKSWKEFLDLIGIKTNVTGEMFIRFANQVARDGSRSLTKPIIEKSYVLVEYVIKEPIEWSRDDYDTISHIRFIVPHETQSRFTSVCKQRSENETLICFFNSISYRYEALSWTSLPLLPREADPYSNFFSSESENKQKEAVLGIVHAPTLDSVILHCQNLCDSLKTCLEDFSRQESICSWLESYMEKIYSYLRKNALSADTCKNRLYHTPVVYIPKLKTVVPAHQTVITIYPDQEIEPYLVKAPSIYGKFSGLFKYLGAADRPSFMLYVNVLATIKENVGENVLDDQYISEWGAITAALDNMFKTLMPDVPIEAPPRGTVLFLPSRSKQLLPSWRITVSDNFHQERRLHNSAPLQYFIGFRRLELRHGTIAISSIPESLRPKYLTQVIKEEIDLSEMRPENCHEAGRMESFLQSPSFIQGLLRLLKHTKTKRSEILTPEEEENVSSELQSVQVQAVSGLRTFLYINGNRIDGSAEQKKNHYHKEDGHWWIYFQTIPNAQQDWLKDMHNCVVRFVNRITNYYLNENVIVVLQMIHMINNSEEISLMLDQMNIDAYDLPHDFLPDVFPPPGTYVPVELHHLLNCEFSTFGIHEYKCVAFELEDPELLDDNIDFSSNSPVYIYVRIKNKIDSDDTSSVLMQLYEIYTGTESITVPAFRLYKFIRSGPEKTSSDIVSTDVPRPSISGQSLNKEMYSVRFQLREAWKLPETDRRRIIKRILLRWHPDKNIGNEEFSTKMFLYIKECIRRLENGIPFDDEDVTDGFFQQARAYPDFTGSQYFEFCERMNRRSHSHQVFAQEYYSDNRRGGRGTAHRRSGYTQKSDYTHFDSDERVYNDHGEARRWYSQAKVDLRYAKGTIDTPGIPPIFNWICYLCHQASEKSMKAAWFSKNANKVPRQSHDLRVIASGLGAAISGCASELTDLTGEHTKMRYPDVLQRPHIPSTVFTREQAEQACEIARRILNLVEEEYIS